MRLAFAANQKRLTGLIRTKPELVLPLREFRATLRGKITTNTPGSEARRQSVQARAV
jgi:hypothetical protein